MRVEPHRLGIDRDRCSKIYRFGKVAVMQLIGHFTPRAGYRSRIGGMHPASLVRPSGVEPPLLSEHGPEPCASANSATGALKGIRRGGDKPGAGRCQRKSQPSFDYDLNRVFDSLACVFEGSRQLVEREGVGVDEPGIEP